MATSNTSARLNAEPSQPDERESQHLQPKSYVDAVLQNPVKAASETANGTTGPNGAHGTTGTFQDEHANGSSIGSGQGTSILQIVQMHDATAKSPGSNDINGDSANGPWQGDQEKRPGVERQESKHEYSATVRTR